jgi:crotonobetainyl-CoA:carnitine CoA-transferase CaiB-like acyl-CoA transferase
LSGAAEPRYTCPPGLGEHTERVLRELVGYSTEQLTHLKRAGVIA